MTDLAAFVRARLWEAQQAAEKCPPAPWTANAEHDTVLAADNIEVFEGFALSSHQIRSTVDYIVRNDPSEVMRDIVFKRSVLDLWIAADKAKPFSGAVWAVLREVVYGIAALYNDHPEYDPKWRPMP